MMESIAWRALLGRSIIREFNSRAFRFEHPDPYALSLPQWEWMDKRFYISFRCIVAMVLITWLTCEIPSEMHQLGADKPVLLFFAYATEWAFLLYTFTTIAFAVFSIFYRLNRDHVSREDMIGNKVLWFCFTLSANTVLTTSGIYWIGFWDRDYAYFFKLASKLKHSIAAVLMITDIFVNNIPIRLVHGIYPLILGIIYGLFSYIYWITGSVGYIGNGIIYPILNWNKPINALGACVGALLFCIVIQGFMYLLYFARTYLSYYVGGRGVDTFRSLCPESTDEGQLINREVSDLETGYERVQAPKSYNSPE